jgi:uncharacterized protein YegP (UPF0339 family)
MARGTRPYRIEVYADNAGEHRWRMKAPNGKIVADSGEGYERRAAAIKAASKLCELAKPNRRTKFLQFVDADGHHRWHLVAPNGRRIADCGEPYATPATARRAVERIVCARVELLA